MPKNNIIELKTDAESCMNFAEQFLMQGKYLEAMQNLNEAMRNSGKEEIDYVAILLRILFVLSQTQNYDALYEVFTHFVLSMREGDSYIMDELDKVMREMLLPQLASDSYGEDNELEQLLHMGDIKKREAYVRAREYAKNRRTLDFMKDFKQLYLASGNYRNSVLELYFSSLAVVQNDAEMMRIACGELYNVMLLDGEVHSDMLRYMLSYGGDEMRKEMIADAEVYREALIGNALGLLDIGIGFMLCGQSAIAEPFFKSALDAAPFDEELLWTASLNYFIMGNKTLGRRYLNAYAELFSCISPPIELYRAFFETCPEPSTYPYVPKTIIDHNLKRAAQLKAPRRYYDALRQTFQCCTFVDSFRYIDLFSKYPELECSEKKTSLQFLISNSKVYDDVKQELFRLLLNTDFVGYFSVLQNDRIYFGLYKSYGAGKGEPYADVYKNVVAELPFMQEFLELDCDVLDGVVEQLRAKYVPEDAAKETQNLTFAALVLYAREMKVNVQTEYYVDILGVKRTKFFRELCQNEGIIILR